VRGKLSDFDMIVSHSLGGAVVATTVAGTISDHPALPVSKLVLISSPDSMSKLFNDFAAMIGLSKKASESPRAVVTQLTGKVTDDFATGAQLQGVCTQLLLIHAPDDKEVPYRESESIACSNSGAVLKPMPALGHRRIIASADVVQATVNFIAD